MHHHSKNVLHAEPIHLLYDKRMLQHRPLDWKEPAVFPRYRDEAENDYPIENPERIKVLYNRLCALNQRLVGCNGSLYRQLIARKATKEEVLLAHSESQYDRLHQLEFQTDDELREMSNDTQSDMYYCQESFYAARLAAGGLLECIDAICSSPSSSEHMGSTATGSHSHQFRFDAKPNKALALVRPPGHHACQSKEMGFCFIDSVVIAAKYALANKKAKKVLILDWDIHDGNATAEGTIENENIFRVDLHRYNPKHPFYPFTGSPRDVGNGKARGLNLNVAWSKGGMGNREYGAAFYELILPLITDYQPDLVIISCGLDAAMGDLLGDCCLTPGFFHAMTRAVIEAVGPDTPILSALEGGYTISVIPDCMEGVTLAMLNLPYSYSSGTNSGFYQFTASGAAAPSPDDPDQVWTPRNALARSRRVLSQYYVRLESVSLQLEKSAVRDINSSIRIFEAIRRWKHVPLKSIRVPNTSPQIIGQKHGRQKQPISDEWPIPYARPKIYMWYGTEAHHQKTSAV
ncbi:unnamed protein product [Cylindrotheca closterium]|uniref:histone deacetylase n=1 Tax=Cylindrotheca closterium TaxID=2856 RepID=A0AAD2FST7_9STRA|nr:unnamed protein product [Cylindrotheca closterium]